MSERLAFDWRVYRAIAIAFIATKLVLLAVAHPFMDETYYWLWGQHLALSYFDHPPLIGWTQAAASLLGWNVFGLRAVTVLTLIGDVALLYGFARHLSGEAWRQSFWLSVMLLVTTPIFFALTTLALPDHLLLFTSLLAVYAFVRFAAAYAAGVRRWRFLYLAAFAIGLATLSKYTGAILLAGAFLALVWHRPLRSVFRRPHPYLAALLAIAMQAPVLVWNLQNGFASFGFITGGRRPLAAFDLNGLWGYLGGFLLILSPFLIWPIIRFATGRGEASLMSRFAFWLSTLAFFAASLFTNILVHWNLVAYAAALPFLQLRSRLLVAGHVLFGLLIAGVLAFNTTAAPVMAFINFSDQTSAWSYGWDEVAREVDAVAKTEGTDFIAGTEYSLASPLAFALADPDVVSLASRVEAFDFWFEPQSRAGQTAIVVGDRWRPLSEDIRQQFGSVEEVRTIAIERLGKPVDAYTIYIARAYAPSIQ